MQPYNVEIFDRDFNLIQHYNIENIEYSFDYLSDTENSASIPFNENVEKGDYIRIVNNEREYFGYISSLVVDESLNGFCTVGFMPFMSLFNENILFNILSQGSGDLEDALGAYISANWISNTDTAQNIPGLSVESISGTANWTFYVTNEDGLDYQIVNFMELIKEALVKYQVALFVNPDFTTKTIKIEIGKKTVSRFWIEADLPTVLHKSIIINQTDSDINKLVVYDAEDLETKIIYYLHPDGSYNTTDNNRIVPVKCETVSASAPSGGTFADGALEAANNQFGNRTYNNLIEITVMNDDDLVKASELEIGRLVNVISNGVTYPSILTGYDRKDTMTLIFGTIRVELTKILKEALK